LYAAQLLALFDCSLSIVSNTLAGVTVMSEAVHMMRAGLVSSVAAVAVT
jgi:hypothetical protein